jgi:magnesium transporter
MLIAFSASGTQSVAPDSQDCASTLQSALWIDLFNPTVEETRAVEAALKLQLPTRVEAQEIEISSRLYVENGTAFMTATVMVGADTPHPETSPVTFAYQPRRLVTLRFAAPKPFLTFPRKLARSAASYSTAPKLLLGLMDEVVDRVADILEAIGADLNSISRDVFFDDRPRASRDYTDVLTRIGHIGERAANARESLVTVSRLLAFFAEARPNLGSTEPIDEHWLTVVRDVSALTDHATFLSNKVNFFLDATLGRINIDQNRVIKMFSVLAVILGPPTLVASVYGMNFEFMPELGWALGYPYSLLIMAISAVGPYAFFRWKRWM